MDIRKETVKPAHWRKFLLPAAGLCLLGGIYWASQSYLTGGYMVKQDNLLLGEVQQGPMQVTVRGAGVLVPRDVRWIAATVEGRVERILVKPGALVSKGEMLLEMSNPLLNQLAEETQWELEALQAQSHALKVELESVLLDQQASLLNAKLNYESAKLKLEAETELLNKGMGTVSMLEYKNSQLNTQQFLERWDIEKARLAKMKENLEAQLSAQAAKVAKLQKTLERAQEQVDSLQVRASIDGVLQALPLEPGQQVLLGGNIAKLARQDVLLAELKIPELQIRDVRIGQRVEIDTRNSKIEGQVMRIDPAVDKGTVQVDVALPGTLPKDARPDLSIEGTIAISELDNALYVPRPLFAQSHSTGTLYRLSPDGSVAERVQVTFGIGSSQFIEIKQGLPVGAQVILSDPSAWESYQTIRIN
ncbi:HlyD family efflux transporter periplasmic adaptor subunit [Aliiglaciecola sp. CAU 1673]|uniref:efflux RND transporter periplasmic adaptor subunit n=1 Tax=Aliiglaciecola sp. CAU 1673 TaxID=3032595 RepID=UPI0023DA0FD8|nr:HlyD family efflux transporter periplasmic adaptor subunit [Aliiglaciecola sp. CAU 1673]MDF2177155.1 HlyD family efflux transporter periplasmic adaptor subunit [Aliiglaciecola sp. CAU 1673]